MILLGDWAPGDCHVRLETPDEPTIVNVEGPIVEEGAHTAAAKAGPTLRSGSVPEIAKGSVAVLANNHTMDFGEAGLNETLGSLHDMGIKWCGAGIDVEAARKPAILTDLDAVRYGVISCCEAQFGVARRNCAGVAEIGPWIYDAIKRLKCNTDCVVVSIHGAPELSPWPSPRWQQLLRSFVEAGAQIVHGHHSHVPQGIEEYEHGLISYGHGNLAVNPAKWGEIPDALWSSALQIKFCNDAIEWQRFALKIYPEDETAISIRLASSEDGHALEYMKTADSPLSNEDSLEAIWQEVALRLYENHFAEWLGFQTQPNSQLRHDKKFASVRQMLRAVKNRFLNREAPRLVRTKQYLLWYHLFACHSHSDAIRTALGVLGGEIPDKRTNRSQSLVCRWAPWL